MTKEQWNELFSKVNDMPVEELEKIIINSARKAGIFWYEDKELAELVEELRKESCGAKTTCWWRAADAIEELLPFKKQVEKGMGLLDKADKLLSAIKPRWIPVTERLPESMHEYVLCCGEKGGQFVGWIGEGIIVNGKARAFQHGGKGRYITHWMPLPIPPKNET